MAKLKPELKEILDRYEISPTDKSQIWDCHGTLVLYHKAYEIIAAKEAIRFDPPTIIEGSSEKKTVAILVVGHMDNRSEWSIGEAAPGNNKNTYPYAMAEKRAKDRVIAKLVGLAAYVYSEDEADEFKDGPRKAADDTVAEKPADKPADPPPPPLMPHKIKPPQFGPDASSDEKINGWRNWANVLKDGIDNAPTLDELNKWVSLNDAGLDDLRAFNPSAEDFLLKRATNKRGVFAQAPHTEKAA